MNQVRMPSPAILVAVLALVAALAGTAVAGRDATTSASVKKTQFKKLKTRVKALEQQGQQPGPQGPPGAQGEQGLPGQPGQDATNLFAYIRDDGNATVVYGTGITVNDPAGNGTYTVTFNQSVVNCVVQAAAGAGDPPGGAPVIGGAFPTFDMSAGSSSQISVTFIDTASNVTDTSFLITAFC